jgi:hypothetical protein
MPPHLEICHQLRPMTAIVLVLKKERRVGQARFERRTTIRKSIVSHGGPARRSAACPTLLLIFNRRLTSRENELADAFGVGQFTNNSSGR